MRLKVIGSSSAGNGYILENDREALLIEAGCRFAEVKEALGYNIRKVAGCIVSHEHKDHARYVEEVKAAGIPVIAVGDCGERAADISNAIRTASPRSST